jgi:hypothetical protein
VLSRIERSLPFLRLCGEGTMHSRYGIATQVKGVKMQDVLPGMDIVLVLDKSRISSVLGNLSSVVSNNSSSTSFFSDWVDRTVIKGLDQSQVDDAKVTARRSSSAT